MTLKIKQASRKTFDVDFVEVTAENMEEVADWCGGKMTNSQNDGGPYIKITDKMAVNSRQTKAFAGDLILKSPNGFKIYSKTSFRRSFDIKVPVDRDAGSGKFVSHEEAAANPGTTVHESVVKPGSQLDETVATLIQRVEDEV